MVAELRVDPCNAGGARFFDGDLGRALHDQVTHTIVAIQQSRADLLAHHPNVWPNVEAAGLDATGILRQPGHAVPVRSLQVCFRHQRGDGHRV
jgi:hypothetical protein